VKVGINTATWGLLDSWDETYGHIKSMGYEGVEPVIVDKEHKELAASARRAGLAVCSISGGMQTLTSGDRGELEELKERARMASEVDCSILMVCAGWLSETKPGWQRDFDPSEEDYARISHNLEELSLYAAELGVTVALHNHITTAIETTAEIDRVLTAAPHLTLCLDVAHFVFTGEDVIRFIRTHSERIGYMHVKDWRDYVPGRRVYTPEHFVELGRGNAGLDFAAIMKTLEQGGYDGWVTVELDGVALKVLGRTPDECARISREHLTQLGY